MVELSHAGKDEAPEIAAFMAEVFHKAKWGIDTWQALLDARWCPDLPVAVTIRDKGKLVGCLGLVHSRRALAGETHTVVNMSSWYLLKPYRGMGLGRDMMAAAAMEPAWTTTNLSSAPAAVPSVYSAGLELLDETRLIWEKRGPSPLQARAPAPGEPWGAMLAEHAGLPISPWVFDTPDGPCLLVLSVKPISEAGRTHDLLYVSDRDVMGRNIRHIADGLLTRAEDILSIDSRFVADPVSADRAEPLAVPRFYKAGSLPAHQVDHIYSEIQLLDLKLY